MITLKLQNSFIDGQSILDVLFLKYFITISVCVDSIDKPYCLSIIYLFSDRWSTETEFWRSIYWTILIFWSLWLSICNNWTDNLNKVIFIAQQLTILVDVIVWILLLDPSIKA